MEKKGIEGGIELKKETAGYFYPALFLRTLIYCRSNIQTAPSTEIPSSLR